jgi:hypothetical protein
VAIPVLAVQVVPPSPELKVPLLVLTTSGCRLTVADRGPALIQLTTALLGSPSDSFVHVPGVASLRKRKPLPTFPASTPATKTGSG